MVSLNVVGTDSDVPGAADLTRPDIDLSLSWLLAQKGLNLEKVHDSGRKFSAIHPCELVDPREFIGAGSVVLLTGIAFAHTPQELPLYVRKLAEAGVAGIGFGLGIAFDEVPSAMIDAAKEAEISLFIVPLETPFISLQAALHREVIRQRDLAHAELLERQQLLNEAAAQGLPELISRTAQALQAHMCLVDLDGRIAAQARIPGAEELDFRPIVEETSKRKFGIAAQYGSFNVIAQRLQPQGGRIYGLIAAAPHLFSSHDRTALKHAAGLAELIITRPRELRTMQQELNSLAIAIQIGLSKDQDSMQRIFHHVGDADGRVRPVLVKSNSPQGHHRFMRNLDQRLASYGRMLFALPIDATTSFLIFRGTRSVENIRELFLGMRTTQRIAVGVPLLWSDLNETVVEELQRVVFRLQAGTLVGPEAKSLNWLGDVQVRSAIDYRVKETWGRLQEIDAGSRTDFACTLEAFLRNGGNISHTAEELETHRHTVRRRMEEIAEILELDLKDPLVAAELLILGNASAASRSD